MSCMLKETLKRGIKREAETEEHLQDCKKQDSTIFPVNIIYHQFDHYEDTKKFKYSSPGNSSVLQSYFGRFSVVSRRQETMHEQRNLSEWLDFGDEMRFLRHSVSISSQHTYRRWLLCYTTRETKPTWTHHHPRISLEVQVQRVTTACGNRSLFPDNIQSINRIASLRSSLGRGVVERAMRDGRPQRHFFLVRHKTPDISHA